MPLAMEDTWGLIRSIIDDGGYDFGGSAGSCAAGLATRDQVEALREHYRLSVAGVVDDWTESTGCDLGCWFGFSSLMLHGLGPRRVVGVDVEPRFIEVARAWSADAGIDGLRFECSGDGVVPVESGSVDWVVVNQVLCNADPATIRPTFAEAARILRPGGRLVLSDSNNPHCPEAIARLKAAWARYEGPDGVHVRTRRRIIRGRLPGLDEPRADELARETCYLGGDALLAAIRAFGEAGARPRSRFDPDALRPTCDPNTGRANGNITDPHVLRTDLTDMGFDAHVTISPGGAPHDDPDVLAEHLRMSQGFYVYGVRRESGDG